MESFDFLKIYVYYFFLFFRNRVVEFFINFFSIKFFYYDDIDLNFMMVNIMFRG